MTELLQQVVDGFGRGGIYALIALGIAVIFGVMHLVNFAHGELITVSAYAAYGLFVAGWDWWLIAPAIVLIAGLTSVAIEFVAFRWVRGAPDFTMLMTSFGVHFLVQAAFVKYVSANFRQFPRPGWIFQTWKVGGVSLEVFGGQKKHGVICLGQTDKVTGVAILSCVDEVEVMNALQRVITDSRIDPDMVTGYNIYKFDLQAWSYTFSVNGIRKVSSVILN